MLPDPDQEQRLAQLVESAAAAGEDIAACLAFCREFGRELPLPGGGRTAHRWLWLREIARVNLTAARVFEAHTDALSILGESGRDLADERRSWGVFAAEAPGKRVDARRDGSGVRLTGVKPWCSLGGSLDAALVTAYDGQSRGLFAVDLHAPGVRAEPSTAWVARGLRNVVSGPVTFDYVSAEQVGDAGWYLGREGFAWGGIGVAACWHGAALGLADALLSAARAWDRALDALHVGTVDRALHASRCVLETAAQAIDAGQVEDPALLALRTRSIVAESVESVLREVGHALGPAPLSFDADHAARVADLTLYVRQHHGERDLAALGAAVIAADT